MVKMFGVLKGACGWCVIASLRGSAESGLPAAVCKAADISRSPHTNNGNTALFST